MLHSSVARLVRLIVIIAILLSAIPFAPASGARLGTKSANVELFAQPATANAPLSTLSTSSTSYAPHSTVLESAPLITPTLEMGLAAQPEAVAPGDVVTFTVVLSNTSDAPASGVILSTTLPDGLQFIRNQPGWTCDMPGKHLSAIVGDLSPHTGATLYLQVHASGPVDNLTELAMEARSGEVVLSSASASVWVANPTRATINPGGGVLQATDGRV
jgi:uncharacterized repeat protein (TIGR01451 family)